MKNLSIIIRIFLGILFTTSGILKVTDLMTFSDAIERFDILPGFIAAATIIIPSIEITAGLMLILGIFKRVAVVALILLIIIFVIGISINLQRGIIFDCGCFGPLNIFTKISFSKLLFDFSLLGGLGLVLWKDTVGLNFIKHLKVILTFSFFTSMLVFIPFNKASWYYVINLKNLQKINWREVTELSKRDDVIILDSRKPEDFNKENVPNSVNFPSLEFEKYYPEFRKILINKLIIIYCDGSKCSASTKLALNLLAKGFNNIFLFSEGFELWEERK